METRDVLAEAFGRIRDGVHRATEGLDAGALTWRPDPDANTIAWLVWHLTRVQDDHVSELAGRDQAWTADGWHARSGLPFDPAATGYGHSTAEVGQVAPDDPGWLLAYHDAVSDRTGEYLATVDAAELDRIIDDSWDPPVSVGVRLVSVISDSLQHIGQAGYLRGMVERS